MGKLGKHNIPGQAHFITAKTFENKQIFKDDRCCKILLEDIDFYRQRLGFKLLGYVIMPDHLHMIVWWDADEQKDLTISRIMQAIKSHSAKEIVNYLQLGRRKPSLSPYSKAASEGSPLPDVYYWINNGIVHTPSVDKIWEKTFYDFNIYSPRKMLHKLNYIHQNPARAGFVSKPTDYLYSSARNYYLNDNFLIEIDCIGL